MEVSSKSRISISNYPPPAATKKFSKIPKKYLKISKNSEIWYKNSWDPDLPPTTCFIFLKIFSEFWEIFENYLMSILAKCRNFSKFFAVQWPKKSFLVYCITLCFRPWEIDWAGLEVRNRFGSIRNRRFWGKNHRIVRFAAKRRIVESWDRSHSIQN